MILFSMISCKPEKLNTHRLDLMPKIHTSYPIWQPCDKGELFLRKRESSNGYLFQMEHGYNDIENQKFISSGLLDKPTLFNKKSGTIQPNI